MPLQEETNERKNALEAYVYDLRNKLYDTLAPFVREVGARLAVGVTEWTFLMGAAAGNLGP